MTRKHFDAILAKNAIANLINRSEPGNYAGEVSIPSAPLINYLLHVEEYIGEGNQPPIKDLLDIKEATL